jgi:predicted DNA-binding transcriptional regulator AlpA
VNDRSRTATPNRIAQPLTITLSIEGESASNLVARLEDVIEAAIQRVLNQSRPTKQPGPQQTQEARMPPHPYRSPNEAQPGDLGMAVLMGRVPEGCGLLIDTHVVAKLLDVSERTVFSLQTEKQMPAPIRFGRAVKWRLAEILEWVGAGCPPEAAWLQRKKQAAGPEQASVANDGSTPCSS